MRVGPPPEGLPTATPSTARVQVITADLIQRPDARSVHVAHTERPFTTVGNIFIMSTVDLL
jgi:hypothetical protein